MSDPFGCYRVLEPPGALPQNCWKLDADPTPKEGETLLEVEILNVDSASFRQLREQSSRLDRPVGELIEEIVRERGKLHNPVTGSGGMLLAQTPGGARIATLVSLTLTPLRLQSIHRVDLDRAQVHVTGQAILFPRTLYCTLPEDFSESAALALFDVAGAPARCARYCGKMDEVVLIGAGKAAWLVAAAVRRENPAARIGVIDHHPAALTVIEKLALSDWTAVIDATRPLDVFRAVEQNTAGRMAAMTLNLVNSPGTEGASILATRDRGRVDFFSMATDFARAALTAEGVGLDLEMMIGSGYARGWTDYALALVRGTPGLLELFEERFGGA